MVWIRCVRCENIRCNFVARTFVLIGPVQPILHRVSCSNEMVPNAPKQYETHQNISLGSDGVYRVDLLQKNSNATLWLELLHLLQQFVPFQPSIVKQRNGPKCIQTLRNQTKVCGPMGWIGCIRCDKFRHDFVA